jgi:hypothetical protein
MRDYPYAFHVALDGAGLNGLEGRAGICVFKYDPADGAHAYKVTYFDGVAGGHAPSVDPSRRTGFLGNAAQHLLFYDAATGEEADRVSTLRFEVPDSPIKGSTHLVWLDDTEFLTAIGEQFWRFDVNRLTKAEPVAPHGLKIPHAMKRTASGRYVVYGGMDHPGRGEAKEVGILDLVTGSTRRVELPTTCWHVACHPVLDVFYAVSFRVAPGDGHDWHEWAMSYLREYAYEIDAESGQVLRHWSGGREIPAHVNSDVTISDTELIFCTGGSQTVVLIDLDSLAAHRLIDENPGVASTWTLPRQSWQTVVDTLSRGTFFTNTKHYVGALQVSRGAFVDGIYACQLSADQTLLFTANRGQNHITVYDYPSLRLRDRVPMPELQEFDARLATWSDPRLGFHHSYLVSPGSPSSPEPSGPELSSPVSSSHERD